MGPKAEAVGIMKRYTMISIPGGCRETESETGRYVLYSDVEELLKEIRTRTDGGIKSLYLAGNGPAKPKQRIAL